MLRFALSAVRNLEAGVLGRLSLASSKQKDQFATKRVESLRVPCLDVGSTPTISTKWGSVSH